MKTKKTLELGEKELAVKSKYYSILEDKYANAGKLDEKDLMGFVSVSGLDDIKGITKQDFSAITFRAKELIDNGMRPDTAIKNATAQVAAENRVDEKPGFFKSFTNWFKGLGGGDTIPIEE